MPVCGQALATLQRFLHLFAAQGRIQNSTDFEKIENPRMPSALFLIFAACEAATRRRKAQLAGRAASLQKPNLLNALQLTNR